MLRAMGQGEAKREMLVVAAGMVVLGAGVVLGAMHAPHVAAMVVRWVGVLLLMVFAWRRRADGVDLCGDGGGSGAGVRCAAGGGESAGSFGYLSAADQDDCCAADSGHADCGDCGAWRSEERGAHGVEGLVYFEVVTTLALVIGLVAINVSKAGWGWRWCG